MTFINPGQLFLTKHGIVETAEDFFAYVDFLRNESGQDGRKSAWFQTQNLPFNHEGETQVLSLIEFLG